MNGSAYGIWKSFGFDIAGQQLGWSQGFFNKGDETMKKIVLATAAAVAAILVSASAQAQNLGTPVFSNLPAPIPGNVPSQPFQAQQTSEFGDEITLAAGPRYAGYATVLMSNWARHSDYPGMSPDGFSHLITLNIYLNAEAARNRTPVKTVTQVFIIPWRPASSGSCPDQGYGAGFAWLANDGKCYNGHASLITFDLRALSYNLPNTFIYGIAYNTNTWGYHPLNIGGPYESLNVGTANVNDEGVRPSVGIDFNPDMVYWNTNTAGWYADNGVSGTDVFRPDTGWTDYAPAVRFTTFGFPTDVASCKNGAWQQLVRRGDFSTFKNQGACVSYVDQGG